MSDETINEVEATETTEAIEQVTEQVTEDMPLPEGLETAGAKGDDNVLNTLLGVMAEQEDAQPSEEPTETVVMDEAPTQAEESEPEPTADNRGTDYERALAALLRDGTPRHILDEEYDRNPDRFVEWGLKRAKVQAAGRRSPRREHTAGPSSTHDSIRIGTTTLSDCRHLWRRSRKRCDAAHPINGNGYATNHAATRNAVVPTISDGGAERTVFRSITVAGTVPAVGGRQSVRAGPREDEVTGPNRPIQHILRHHARRSAYNSCRRSGVWRQGHEDQPSQIGWSAQATEYGLDRYPTANGR